MVKELTLHKLSFKWHQATFSMATRLLSSFMALGHLVPLHINKPTPLLQLLHIVYLQSVTLDLKSFANAMPVSSSYTEDLVPTPADGEVVEPAPEKVSHSSNHLNVVNA